MTQLFEKLNSLLDKKENWYSIDSSSWCCSSFTLKSDKYNLRLHAYQGNDLWFWESLWYYFRYWNNCYLLTANGRGINKFLTRDEKVLLSNKIKKIVVEKDFESNRKKEIQESKEDDDLINYILNIEI